MGQSLVKNYLHIVFSTKNREPLIDVEIEAELHAYLALKCNEQECPAVIVGGFVDHVHILCSLSKKVKVMDLMEELKKHSSRWIKSKGEAYQHFYWQNGYGAFSISSKDVGMVMDYIEKQHDHHNSASFQEEYRLILNESGTEYDERYVWD